MTELCDYLHCETLQLLAWRFEFPRLIDNELYFCVNTKKYSGQIRIGKYNNKYSVFFIDENKEIITENTKGVLDVLRKELSNELISLIPF